MTSTNPPPTQAPSTKDTILETGASATQTFDPISSICAHLNAFHVYVDDLSRPPVEANHYCTHVDADLRQCLIYDSSAKNARLIGVEYIITKRLFDTLEEDERALWHSHDYEVRSGLLVMPNSNVPEKVWEKAETEEMKELVGTYGKIWGTWQVDKNARVPLGRPVLMAGFTGDEQVPWDRVNDRDERFGVNTGKKKEARKGIEEADVSADVDGWWKERR